MPVDESADSRAERLFLVASDPDQIPIGGLQARRERGPETGTGADTDTTLIECRSVGDTGELELTSPEMRRWVVYEATSEIALDTTDEVVVLGVCTFGDGAECVILSSNQISVRQSGAEELSPTSIIDDRLMRASSPCCIPRSKRRTATLGEGYVGSVCQYKRFMGKRDEALTISTSTLTSRTVNHGMRMKTVIPNENQKSC